MRHVTRTIKLRQRYRQRRIMGLCLYLGCEASTPNAYCEEHKKMYIKRKKYFTPKNWKKVVPKKESVTLENLWFTK